jgi:hypothetical protein
MASHIQVKKHFPVLSFKEGLFGMEALLIVRLTSALFIEKIKLGLSC